METDYTSYDNMWGTLSFLLINKTLDLIRQNPSEGSENWARLQQLREVRSIMYTLENERGE